MPRAAVILIENDQLALIERKRAGETYFLFPGGQVEDDEELEATTIREAYEELGVDVALRGRPVWVPLAQLPDIDCRPRDLARSIVEASISGWPEEPLRFVES